MTNSSSHRYLPPVKWLTLFNSLGLPFKLKTIGYSVENRPIQVLVFGNGMKKVLGWSQMHGNETTTTYALLDLVSTLLKPSSSYLLDDIQFAFIFQLNPDGAVRYTRLNAVHVDLNRDASEQSQPETQTLIDFFESFKPDYCLNLHGQRTVFAAGDTEKSASLSFLAPAANFERSHTPARKKAMAIIARASVAIQSDNQWGIGKYDDTFNINCTGDYFTAKGVPTILVEAGHFPNDYDRLMTRKLVLSALEHFILSIHEENFTEEEVDAYMAIPNNFSHLCDVAFTNVFVIKNDQITNSTLFVQFEEELEGEKIIFRAKHIENENIKVAHKTYDLHGINRENPINLEFSPKEIAKTLFSLL